MKKTVLMLALMVAVNSLCAQNATITPNSVHIPSLTYDAMQALPTPVKGQAVYDLTFLCLRIYNGTKWVCTFQRPTDPPNIIAVASVGGTGQDSGEGIAVDALGNVYVTGFYQGTATFGSTVISSAGQSDIFVAKYNSAGTVQWVRSAGGAGNDGGTDIAVDASGNVYVTGYFMSISTFGSTPITTAGGTDIFVTKYDSGGTQQWVRSAGGTNFDQGNGIAVDASGNIHVAGYYQVNATFGSTPVSAVGESDIFVAQYNSTGTLQWVRSAGGTIADLGNGVAIDASGNVYVTGYYQVTATFGGIPITSAGGSDIFVAKYNSAGTVQWVRSAGGTNSDLANSIAVDASDNVYLTGFYQGTVTFGSTPTTPSVGGNEIFVAKYNSAGTVQWVRSAGGTGSDLGTGIAVDASGNVFVTGYYEGTATFGGIPTTSAGSFDTFMTKYNSAGTVQGVQSAGGSSDDRGHGIAVNAPNNVFVTGRFLLTATFGGTAINSAGQSDIFVARMDN